MYLFRQISLSWSFSGFTCASCGTKLRSFFEKNGVPYCEVVMLRTGLSTFVGRLWQTIFAEMRKMSWWHNRRRNEGTEWEIKRLLKLHRLRMGITIPIASLATNAIHPYQPISTSRTVQRAVRDVLLIDNVPSRYPLTLECAHTVEENLKEGKLFLQEMERNFILVAFSAAVANKSSQALSQAIKVK